MGEWDMTFLKLLHRPGPYPSNFVWQMRARLGHDAAELDEVALGGGSFRSCSQAKITGVTTRMWMSEDNMPLTTGAARGRITSTPVRVLQKIGSRPAMAVATVITFGGDGGGRLV